MNTFLNQIQMRKNAPEAVAHKAALYLSTQNRKIILTEAGDDSYFYTVMLKRHVRRQHEIAFFEAYGRSRVKSALQILKSMGKGDRAYGIIDRDFYFDEPGLMFDGHLLIIDVYSVENYFANLDFMVEFGKTIFGLEAESDQLKRWHESVLRFYSEVGPAFLPLHVIALWCRKRSKNCNLSNFRPASYFALDVSGTITVDKKIEAAFIDSVSADITLATSTQFDECRAEIEAMHWFAWCRGHYFFDLFVKFLNVFRAAIDEENKANHRSRTRTRAEINHKHAFEAGSPFVPIPLPIANFFEVISA